MQKNAEFDLKKFQSEVFQEFETLKMIKAVALINSEKNYKVKNIKEKIEKPKLKEGLVINFLLKIIASAGKSAEQKFIEDDGFIKNEQKAKEIVENPNIKRVLCRKLKKEITSNLFIEAKMVKIVRILTDSLLEEETAKEFLIEKDAQLFSQMAFLIYNKGISNFCEQRNV